MHEHKLILHISNIQCIRKAYLDQLASQNAIWANLEWFCEWETEWSRAGSEWSRTSRVVARVIEMHCGGVAEWSRTAQVVAHTAWVVAHQ